MTPASQAPPIVPSPSATPTVSPPVPPPLSGRPRLIRWACWFAAGGVAIAAAYVGIQWWTYRLTHSLTDDAVRKGLNIDEYDMTWQQVGYGVGLLFGLFMGLGLSARIGARYTIALGLVGFALGNLLCGAAVGLESFVLGRFVDGFGKMMVMGLCRNTLYKQFDGRLLVAIGFYGTFAYATRNATPLLMAELTVELSWRWMFWFYVPIALVSMVLVWRYFLPDRPPRHVAVPIDRLAPMLFVVWVVAIVFAFSWYRRWGGWTSSAFAATVL